MYTDFCPLAPVGVRVMIPVPQLMSALLSGCGLANRRSPPRQLVTLMLIVALGIGLLPASRITNVADPPIPRMTVPPVVVSLGAPGTIWIAAGQVEFAGLGTIA